MMDNTEFAEIINKKYNDLKSAVETVMEDYSDVMVFDRNRNTSTTVKLNGKILLDDMHAEPRAYSSTWNRYIKVFVVDEDVNPLLRAVENEVIYKKLIEDGCYTHDYNVVYAGEDIRMRVTFVMIQAERKYILFGFKNITKN